MKTKKIRVVLFGQKHFGQTVAESLLGNLDVELIAVYAPEGDRLYKLGKSEGIPVLTSCKEPVPFEYDLGIVANHFQKVEQAELDYPEYGWIGYHPSLLPRHRGKDSIVWACDAGDIITGGTIYQLNNEWDKGLILEQDWIWLGPDRNPFEVWTTQLAPMGVRLINTAIMGLLRFGRYGKPQDERYATTGPLNVPDGSN